MAGFRDKVIYAIAKGGGILPVKLLQKITQQKLILPFYHTISDKRMPHIEQLYPVKSVKAFIKDLDFLLKYYQPIGLEEFVELKRSGRSPDKFSFMLSFDDGLREFHDVIAPILLKKGIPAICFLNTDFIDNKKLFYRYKASLIIDQVQKDPSLIKKIAPFFGGRKEVVPALLAVNYQQKEILGDIAAAIQYDFNDFLSTQKPYLNKFEIQTLINQGFSFGAHSLDHPEYQFIGMEEQVRQTQESMHYMQKEFAVRDKVFSFPFTDYNVDKAFFSHLMQQEIVDFSFGSAGQKKDIIATNFQRIPFEMTHLSGRQIHNAELLYFLFKMPFGKNTIQRK